MVVPYDSVDEDEQVGKEDPEDVEHSARVPCLDVRRGGHSEED